MTREAQVVRQGSLTFQTSPVITVEGWGNVCEETMKKNDEERQRQEEKLASAKRFKRTGVTDQELLKRLVHASHRGGETGLESAILA